VAQAEKVISLEGLTEEQVQAINFSEEPDGVEPAPEEGVDEKDSIADKVAKEGIPEGDDADKTGEAEASPEPEDKSPFTQEQSDEIAKATSSTYSKLHKTFEERDRNLAQSFTKAIDDIRKESRMGAESVLAILEQSEFMLEEGSPAAKAISDYRKTLAETDDAREKDQQKEKQEASINTMVLRVEKTLRDSGIEPTAPEVNSVLTPLMREGRYEEVWPVVSGLIANKQQVGTPTPDNGSKETPKTPEDKEREYERKFRKKYGIDQQDLGAGSGEAISNLNKLDRLNDELQGNTITSKEYLKRLKEINV